MCHIGYSELLKVGSYERSEFTRPWETTVKEALGATSICTLGSNTLPFREYPLSHISVLTMVCSRLFNEGFLEALGRYLAPPSPTGMIPERPQIDNWERTYGSGAEKAGTLKREGTLIVLGFTVSEFSN